MPKFQLTETGNAERFAAKCRNDVRFVPGWHKWYVWDGARWGLDCDELKLRHLVKETHRSIWKEAIATESDDEKKRIAQWAMASEKQRVRDATLSLARSEPGIALAHDSFDRDPMALNVANGTVDLATGKLRPHKREDHLTALVPIHFDATARAPRFEQFLHEIMPDAETVAWLQKAVGYSLTASVAEHCLFFCHGGGANGKSTLFNVLRALLGEDYAAPAPAEMLLAKRGEAHPTELTVLHKRRVILCQEVDQGRSWAEATIKHVTGGDRISARRMREDFWDFTPTHKLWIAANHKPSVRGVDEGIWRRIRLIPFERTFSGKQKDTSLETKLLVELPGILAWAVEGCTRWVADGLGNAEAISRATLGYREESDRLAPFLSEACVIDGGAKVPCKALSEAYHRWCESNGERTLSTREFAANLKARGIESGSVRSGGVPVRGWKGLGLVECRHVDTSRHDSPDSSDMRARELLNRENASTHVYTSTRSTDDDEIDPVTGEKVWS